MTTSPSTVYDRVTSRIIESLERAPFPGSGPGAPDCCSTPFSRRPYSGVNILSTFLHQLEYNVACNAFMTFNQAKQLGGHVRKGERGCLLVYYARVERARVDIDVGEEPEVYFLARGYTVFGLEQCEGLDHLQAKLDGAAGASSVPTAPCSRRRKRSNPDLLKTVKL